jgi:hypothetical protein
MLQSCCVQVVRPFTTSITVSKLQMQRGEMGEVHSDLPSARSISVPSQSQIQVQTRKLK